MTESMMIYAVLAMICFGGLTIVMIVFLSQKISGLRSLVDQQNVIMQSILLKQKKIDTSCQEIAMVDAAIRSQYQNICEAYDRICDEHKKLLGAWKDIYEEYSDNKTCYESLVTNLDGVGGIVEDISEKLSGLGHQFTELNETLKQADISFTFGPEGKEAGIITAPGDPDPSADRFVDLSYTPIKSYLEDDDGS